MMSTSIKRLPLWLRYLVALTVGAAIVVALVLLVDHNQQPLVETPAAADKAQQLQENKEDQVLVRQQQAPHQAVLPAHAGAVAAAAGVITRYMSGQVAGGFITGPVDGAASCASAGGSASRAVLHCSITAGDRSKDSSLAYPFDVVVSPAARTVTYCQVITSPDPSIPSPPISGACR